MFAGRKVVSADTRIVKVWDANDGTPFTSIEPQGVGDINDVCLWPDSGEPSHHSSQMTPEDQQKTRYEQQLCLVRVRKVKVDVSAVWGRHCAPVGAAVVIALITSYEVGSGGCT